MKIEWEHFFIIPTLLERTKLSHQIFDAYLSQYESIVIPTAIRRAVKGQEALVMKQSPIEYAPSSVLAADYIKVSKFLWEQIGLSQFVESTSKPLKGQRSLTWF